MSDLIVSYLQKGLTEDESKVLAEWVEKGKPGLAQVKADNFMTLYLMGYSCKEIAGMFPGYSEALILHARVHYHWDEAKSKYIIELQKKSIEAAVTSKAESISFLSEVLKATHIKWRKELMEYVANPDEKAPDILPKGLGAYGQLTKLIQELINPSGNSKDAKGKDVAASPLVSININPEKKDGKIIEVSPLKAKADEIRKRKAEPTE